MNSARRVRAYAMVASVSVCCAISSHAAPSSRPGWGSIPYSSGGTNGTTFRVWAPNASSVKVGGTFNSFNSSANPLFSEGTSGVWSVDVPNALPGHEYKYYLNGGSL